ncbi:nuclear protein MDM1 isoform X2 [Suncus etruscus]|uniref:nuclear protein MDM1 isoform X2 n=1 Tax=Suncus etruscus TaxID=109475 RepID=UPI00210FB4E5|nr:nuclear protein MDM1 isoform X2 [Suncus etruscus]
MPVRFQGLSEYQRNFLWKKSYLSDCFNPSVARRHPWAGLRSDQFGNQGKCRTEFLPNDISSQLLCTSEAL